MTARRSALAAVLAVVTLPACILSPIVPPSPVPFAPATLPPPRPDDVPVPELADLSLVRPWFTPPRFGGPVDEILGSPAALHPELQERVAWWVKYWSLAAAPWFPGNLERMEWFAEMVDSSLSVRDMPSSLRYLPIIESGYYPGAVSSASAVGLWQLMGPTAQGSGLEVNPLLDERRDPFKSTVAALDFLDELRARFGSWYLALAAYNAGPGRVQRALDRLVPLAPRADSLYWRIRPYLPPETRDFVPKLLGAIVVASNPRAYGFDEPAAGSDLGFTFDEVWVPDATTLDVVARAAESPEDEIHRLNPEIVRGITPPGRQVRLRVPAGRGDSFDANYPRIPPGDRVTFVEHRVRAGETLSHIARRYRLPLFQLRAANPDVRERYLQIGERVTVPVAASAAGTVPSGR